MLCDRPFLGRHNTQASSLQKGNPGWTKVITALMFNLANQRDCSGVTNQSVYEGLLASAVS